jgi:hypothetical protein
MNVLTARQSHFAVRVLSSLERGSMIRAIGERKGIRATLETNLCRTIFTGAMLDIVVWVGM